MANRRLGAVLVVCLKGCCEPFGVDQTALALARCSQCLNFKMDLIVQSVLAVGSLLPTFQPIKGLVQDHEQGL